MLPPTVIRIRVIERGKKTIGLWLPAFLLWPVGLILSIAVVPFLALAAAISVLSVSTRRKLASVWLFVVLVCSLRGLTIDIHDRDDKVFVQIV
jgi:hypothetical protein